MQIFGNKCKGWKSLMGKKCFLQISNQVIAQMFFPFFNDWTNHLSVTIKGSIQTSLLPVLLPLPLILKNAVYVVPAPEDHL